MAPRLQSLDAVRGLAAIWVALFHFNEVRQRSEACYDMVNRWGWLGVSVFFVLSGYCVQLAANRDCSPRIFLLRRFARLYPAYLASIIGIVGLCAERKLATGTNDFVALPKSLLAWLASFSLTTTPLSQVATVNWVYWSLTYEIFFYLALSCSVFWPRVRVAWPLALCAISLVPRASEYVFFLNYWGLFALGVSFGLSHNSPRWQSAVLTLASLASTAFNHIPAETATAAATIVVIWVAPQIEAKWGNSIRLLAWCGKISYGLYLFHVPIGVWIVLRMADSHGWREIGLWAQLSCDGAALAASLIVAATVYSLIEKPGMAWGQRLVVSSQSGRNTTTDRSPN